MVLRIFLSVLQVALLLGGLSGPVLFVGCVGSTPRGGDPDANGPFTPVGTATHRTAADPKLAPEEFRRAESLWLMEQYDEAYRGFIAFTSRHPQSRRLGEAYLYAGMSAEKKGDRQNAIRCFEYAAREPDRKVSARAALEMGEWHMEGEGFADAAGHFRNAGRLAADEETRAEAMLMTGISLQKGGMFEEARSVLHACALNKFSRKYADQARYRLAMESHFTVQVGAFLDEKNAQAKMKALAAAGINAEMRSPKASGVPFFRVLSGRFEIRPDAVAHQTRIRAALGGEKPIIVP